MWGNMSTRGGTFVVFITPFLVPVCTLSIHLMLSPKAQQVNGVEWASDPSGAGQRTFWSQFL